MLRKNRTRKKRKEKVLAVGVKLISLRVSKTPPPELLQRIYVSSINGETVHMGEQGKHSSMANSVRNPTHLDVSNTLVLGPVIARDATKVQTVNTGIRDFAMTQ